MEIEKKYLIRKLPEGLDSFPHFHICQAYIWTDPVIRVRKKDETCFLTLKGKGLLAREETEMEISNEAFDGLFAKREGAAIEKVRYLIPDESGLTIELDVFGGLYEGFIMAEVEFPDLESADSYRPPDWLGREVTGDRSFQNSVLSMNSEADIRDFFRTMNVIEI